VDALKGKTMGRGFWQEGGKTKKHPADFCQVLLSLMFLWPLARFKAKAGSHSVILSPVPWTGRG
jgi:hypothetical protein